MPTLRQNFNPFGKSIGDLVSDDLEILKNTSEGWYIEYKREIPTARSIAKSISAFANAYGGWLIYGVAESSSGDRTAEQFVGLPISEIAALESRIRQAASDSINPSPYFETKVLRGPAAKIGLSRDTAVVVVEIPPSNETPHVHIDGRIYRRVADASEPRPETDRHFLDLLWQRGKARRELYHNTINSIPKASDAETGASYIEVFLFPNHWLEQFPKKKLSFHEFATVMQESAYETGGLPFDNLFSTVDGYIARQVKGNKPERLVLTWRLNDDGLSHITIPLSSRSLDWEDVSSLDFFSGYHNTVQFFARCRADKFRSGTIVDLNLLNAILWGVMRRHEKISELVGLGYPYNLKIRVRGVWRRIPFLDTPSYKSFFEQFGVPVVQTDDAFWPSSNEYSILPAQDADQDSDIWTWIKSSIALVGVCQAFGIPPEKLHGDGEDDEWLFELHSLLERATEAQKNRNSTT